MQPLDVCCQKEADRHLERHRAVAVCDSCRRLLLAYGNDEDYEATIRELTDHEVDFTVGRTGKGGKLRVIAKER